MLILDKDRTLDRMIWLSGRHSVVVPEQLSYGHATAAPDAPSVTVSVDPTWRWSDALAASAPPQPRVTRPGHLPAAA